MEQQLRLFHSNVGQREAVKAFQLGVLRELALDAVFNGEQTTGFVEAKKLIEKTFDKLEDQYGKIKQTEISSAR